LSVKAPELQVVIELLVIIIMLQVGIKYFMHYVNRDVSNCCCSFDIGKIIVALNLLLNILKR